MSNRAMRGRFTAPGAGRALLAGLALTWTLLTWVATAGTILGAARAGQADFFTFLDSGDQFRRGLPLYAPLRTIDEADGARPNHPNLNHPIVTLALLPLHGLPRAAAFLLWTALGVAAYLLALALAARAVRLRPVGAEWLLALALAGAAPGVIYSLQLGQFGLPLALPVVAAWLLLRRDAARVIAAGALVGTLLTLKPFLLPLLGLFLVRRRWPGLLAAGAAGAALSALALPFVGPAAFADWLGALRTVDWYDHGLNISLTGLLYRVAQPAPPVAATWLITATVTLAGWLLVTRRAPRTPEEIDYATGLLLTLSIVGSPLGWLYYTPVLIPALVPLLARRAALPRPARRLLAAACVLLWTPHILLAVLPTATWSQLTLRSTSLYGLLALSTVLALALRAPLTTANRSTTDHTATPVPLSQGWERGAERSEAG